MTNMWTKTKKFVSKYWQILIGVTLAIGLWVRFALISHEQREVLTNEIETNQRVDEIKKQYDVSIAQHEKAIEKIHSEELVKIERTKIKDLEDAKETAVEREQENGKLTGEKLTRRFANTFGAEVVDAEDE